MGKRRGRSETSETLICGRGKKAGEEGNETAASGEREKGKRRKGRSKISKTLISCRGKKRGEEGNETAASGEGEIGKRKEESEISETLISSSGKRGREESNETASGEEKGGFFACYLLTSLSPRHKGRTYIGFTVNPRRRIRQHNGEIGSGAWRTKSKRPWEMVMCIYGFPTNVSALQFEWAWQHPTVSLAVRGTAAAFKSLTGLTNKIKLAYTMFTLPAWHNLHLTVNFFSTKYTKHSAGCPSLPEHMRVQVSSMDELPCYASVAHNLHEDEDIWDDDEICNKTSSAYGSTNERSSDITVESVTDNWMSNGEDIFMKKSGDLLSKTEDLRPIEETLPTTRAGNNNQFGSINDGLTDLTVERVTDRWMSNEDDIVTRNLGDFLSKTEDFRPISKEMLPTNRAGNNDQFPINSPMACGNVAVIDLLTPSPGYRTSPSRKKRNVSCVCPEMIDLTKSPIFD